MAKISLYAVVNCASTVVSGSLCAERNPFLPCNEAELVPRSARFVSDMIKSLLWKETKVTASVFLGVCAPWWRRSFPISENDTHRTHT